MSVKVTLDLWGTLLKSSPYFVQAKYNLTRKFVKTPLTDNEIGNAHAQTKLQLNKIIEVTGWQPTQDAIFQMFFYHLGETNGGIPTLPWLGDFMYQYQELAMKFKPKLYDDNTFRALELLHAEFDLVLSSNTMFLDGKTLEKVLNEKGILEYFKKTLFSSETGFSKPNRIMYDGSDFHIGDNIITDGVGANAAGSQGIIVNSNNRTLHDAYNLIIQKR